MLRSFSVETLAYDATMGDWRTHRGVDIAAEAGIEAVYSYQPYNDMTYGRHRAHISATCEDKALAIRFLDLFYREDYAVQANYGSFTIGSVRRADGTTVVPKGGTVIQRGDTLVVNDLEG